MAKKNNNLDGILEIAPKGKTGNHHKENTGGDLEFMGVMIPTDLRSRVKEENDEEKGNGNRGSSMSKIIVKAVREHYDRLDKLKAKKSK